MLKFPGQWRLRSPKNGKFINENIPEPGFVDFMKLIFTVASQDNRWEILERYKSYFCNVCGTTHTWSSNESWAETDLYQYARQASDNAPLFISAVYDASLTLIKDDDPDFFVPKEKEINQILLKNHMGYMINNERLELREDLAPSISNIEPPLNTDEVAKDLINESLNRSQTLLDEGRGREAVQESLWILETIATIFQGTQIGNTTIQGKYFNKIVSDLQHASPGTTFNQVLSWASSMHGYLSSPTGGGVRHGANLNNPQGMSLSINEARLFCNLIRSYLWYFIFEHRNIVE